MDTDDEARADSEPSKKNCKFDSKICICHSGSSSASSAGLLLFTDVTWKTFLNAAVERSDRRFSDVTGPPQGAYHKKCYHTCTSKSHIERVRKAAVAATSAVAAAEAVEARASAVEIPSQQRKTRRSLPVDFLKCIFCQAEKREKRPPLFRTVPSKLMISMEKRASETEVRAAHIRKDNRLLTALQPNYDFVALEVKYHRNCYASYTSERSLERIRRQQEASDPSDKCENRPEVIPDVIEEDDSDAE